MDIGYIVVGGICLMLGGVIGVFTMALMVASHNADYHLEQDKEAGCDEE